MENPNKNSGNDGDFPEPIQALLESTMLGEVVSDNGGIDYNCQEFRYAFIPSSIFQKEGIDILIFPNKELSNLFVNKRSALIEQGNCLGDLTGPDFENWLGEIQSFRCAFWWQVFD